MKNKLNYNYFAGATLYAFVRAMLKIVDSPKLSDGVLKTLLVKVESIFDSYSKGLGRDANDSLSAKAAEQDALRDMYYSGMKDYVKSFLKSPVAVKASAAQKLVAVIRKHGWSAEQFGYDKETAAIVKCLDEMASDFSAEITELNLQELWLTPLAGAQESFEAVQNQRIANGVLEVPAMSQYRKPLAKAMRTFIETLDTFAENTNDADIKLYASQIDELIGNTMSTLKAVNNRSSNTTGVNQETPATS